MLNIKQKFKKIILSFIGLVSISACDAIKDFSRASNGNGNAIDVAILLPLSGSEADLSKEYAQMIKMGLSDSTKSKIRVTSYDSSDNEKLKASLEKIFETGTDIIIGPVYSETTKIVANEIKGKGTIVLSLSNNPALASDQLFLCGHAPMRQLEQLTNYFLENHYKNYIALLPAGRYSNLTGKILSDMITVSGGTLEKIEFYGNSAQAMTSSVKSVSDTVDSLNENDLNLKQPVIILADDSTTLQLLYDEINKEHLDKKAKIAGDSRADIGSLSPLNVTFTGSLQMVDTDISIRARKAGLQHISFLHAIAYDAGKIVGENIGTGFNKARFLEKMNSSEKFNGISGQIHFIDSIAQRKYDVIRKEGDNYYGK
ncbi:MAG: penicillin-binding protein activator [Rickettsiaceae bacterium]|nr:penicillin-binding protein activator [Rickettsiaceae bacterium]